jgi:hypothetical protein
LPAAWWEDNNNQRLLVDLYRFWVVRYGLAMQIWKGRDKLIQKRHLSWSALELPTAHAQGMSGFALPRGRSNRPRRKPGVNAVNGLTEKFGLVTGPVTW